MNSRSRRRDRTSRGVAVGLAAVVALMAMIATAHAARTRGDAVGVSHATLTGGLAITAHNGAANGGPAGFGPSAEGVRIDPFADGAEYCRSGWHVISTGAAESRTSYARLNDLFEALAAVTFEFRLDGVPLRVQRSSVHRYLNPFEFPGDLFALSAYSYLPPGSLGAGTHELVTAIQHPGSPATARTITFRALAC